MRIVAVVQARTGSTRLPGKVIADVGGRPLLLWTLTAMSAVPSVDQVVAAIPIGAPDDDLAALIQREGWDLHRGPVRDVLARCRDAVHVYEPDVVVRATADNPFFAPEVVERQIQRLVDGGLDYVGTSGWPLGIAAEVATAAAIETAYREATKPAEREHVMPFLYSRPERFRIGSADPLGPVPAGRFTVDTAEDLAFVRAIAARLGSAIGPPSLARLASIVQAEPDLLALNREVRQKSWQEAEA
ncbi:MAG: spore coat protein [Chloroflexota bacterium]